MGAQAPVRPYQPPRMNTAPPPRMQGFNDPEAGMTPRGGMQTQLNWEGKPVSYMPPVDNPNSTFTGRQAPIQPDQWEQAARGLMGGVTPGVSTMSRASTAVRNPLSADGSYGFTPGTDGYNPANIRNNVTGANLDIGRGVDPNNTDPAYWKSIANVGDIGLQESARRRGVYQDDYDPYQQYDREQGGGIGGYTAGQSPGLAALLGGSGGGVHPVRPPDELRKNYGEGGVRPTRTEQAPPPGASSTRRDETFEEMPPGFDPQYAPPWIEPSGPNELQEILRRIGQGGQSGGGSISSGGNASGGNASNQNNINIYTGRNEDGTGTQEQLPPDWGGASDFLNPLLDRLDKPGDPLPQTPGSISGLQGDVAGLLQRYLTGGGASGDIQAGSAGIQALLQQISGGTGLAGSALNPAGGAASKLLGNMPGLTQENIVALTGQSMPNGFGSNPAAGALQGQTGNLLNSGPGLTQQGIQQYIQSLMPGAGGAGQNPNASTLGNSTNYLLGQNALPTFAPSTYDPATGRSSSGTLADIAQGQYADILLGRNQPANTTGMNTAVADQLKNATANTGNVNNTLASFLGGPAWDILSKNFGGNVGTEMDRSQDATRRATDIANAIGNWGVAGTQELGNAAKGLLGGQPQNIGLPGEVGEAAAMARRLGQGPQVANVGTGNVNENTEMRQASEQAQRMNQQGGVSQGLNAFLESGLKGTGLPPEYVDAFARQVYEPQREKLLGSLAQRGVLDSGQRLTEERDLMNQTFNDTLMLKSLDQKNRTADQSLQAAGLGQSATSNLANIGKQFTDLGQQNRSAQMTADLANQDANLRGAGLLGQNIGRGAELLMGAGDRVSGNQNQNFQNRMQQTGVGANLQQQAFGQSTGAANLLSGMGDSAYNRASSNATMPTNILMQAIDRAQGGANSAFQNATSGYGTTTGALSQLLGQAANTGQQAQQNRNQEYGLGLQGYQQQSDDTNRATDRAVNAGTQLQQLLNQQYGLGMEGYGRTSSDIGQAQNYGTQLQQLLNQQFGMGLQGGGMNSDAAMQLLGLQGGLYNDTRNFGLNANNASYGHAADLIGQQLNKDAGIYAADQQRKAGRNLGIGSAIGGIASGILGLFSSEQFKRDIQDADPDEALAKVLSAPLYRFKYRRGLGIDDSGKEHVGIILEDADPAFATADGKRIDVDVVGLLIGAIQAQARQIAALTEKLAEVSS